MITIKANGQVLHKRWKKKISFYICKIIAFNQSEIDKKEDIFYLGKVENMLSYGTIGRNVWDYSENEDLTECVFPVNKSNIFDTKKEAQRHLISGVL